MSTMQAVKIRVVHSLTETVAAWLGGFISVMESTYVILSHITFLGMRLTIAVLYTVLCFHLLNAYAVSTRICCVSSLSLPNVL